MAMDIAFLKSICTVLLAMLILGTGVAWAAPQLDIGQADVSTMRIDVRSTWQTALVASSTAPLTQPLDAQALWALPDSAFQPGKASPVPVAEGKRFVGRLSVLVGAKPQTLVLELPMPRLDISHASYRYNNDAWTQFSAGDQIPMVKWPFVNRNPTFVIPPGSGELQIVLDIPSIGLFPTPVLLWSDPAFRADYAIRNVEAGAALTLSFFTMLVCAGVALVLRRFEFVALGVYASSVFMVAAGQGGVVGQYVGTSSAWFNDYVKYVTGVVFGAVIPWTLSVVCGQKYYSNLVARVATFWMLGSIAAMAVMLFTVSRTFQWALLSPFLIASLVFGLGITLASALRGQVHGSLSFGAVVMLFIGIFAPIASYWGYLDGVFSYIITLVCLFLSTTLLLSALMLQYRHGNRVIARAYKNSKRDALTGLLNRDAFERVLNKFVRAPSASRSDLLFLYLEVGERNALEQEFGGVGFESGLVQIAAALSSSISIVDTVARVSSSAFGVLVAMPQDHKRGSELAQKLISRSMAIANHTAPMTHTALIAAAWLPNAGQNLTALEAAARVVLKQLGEGKRIAWLAGSRGAEPDLQNGPSATVNLINCIEKGMQLDGGLQHVGSDSAAGLAK